LNVTAVPKGRLDFLTVWPAGQPYPNVSTLNSPSGNIIANAAIVPAGTNGGIAVTAGNPTDVIIDINGYFAPPGGMGGLHFYPIVPCRIVDTRPDMGKTGPFGPPGLTAYSGRDIPMLAGSCNIASTAQAYSLNFTVVPQGPLSFLSAWPTGQTYPGVSTLNSPSGNVIANAAIIPAGTGGDIMVTAGGPTDLIIDINGYFAP
jgi:serine protease